VRTDPAVTSNVWPLQPTARPHVEHSARTLKQIELAVHNYHDAHNILAPGVIHSGTASGGNLGNPPRTFNLNHNGWSICFLTSNRGPSTISGIASSILN
jgi:hypothetical protein